MSKNESQSRTVKFLTAILVVVLIILLSLVFYHFDGQKDDSLKTLGLNLIPNFLASLSSIIVILLFLRFTKQTPTSIISVENENGLGDMETLKLINSKLDTITNVGFQHHSDINLLKEKIESLSNVSNGQNAVSIYSNYRAVEWEDLLQTATRLDILVIFYDAWLIQNADTLIDFFSRDGVFRIILPDPENTEFLKQMLPLFPKLSNDPAKLAEKINLTVSTIVSHYKSSIQMHGQHGNLSIYFYKGRINYPVTLIDKKAAVVSNFEHSSDIRTDCPAMLVNYEDLDSIKNFYEKEFAKLTIQSTPYTF